MGGFELVVDIAQVLEDLKKFWQNSDLYPSNPTAFSRVRETSTHFMMCCPFHSEQKPSFGITKDPPYLFNCFSCEESGTVDSLVVHVLGLRDNLAAIRYLTQHYSLFSRDYAGRRFSGDLFCCGSGDSCIEDGAYSSLKLGSNIRYLHNRGLSLRAVQKYELGLDREQGDILFPVRDFKGSIKFVQRRSIYGKSFYNQAGVKKKSLLYGLFYLRDKDIREMFLVESAIDTISCYEAGLPAVSTLGLVLFRDQVLLLWKAGVRVVNLFFDNDARGIEATANAVNILQRLPIQVNVVRYPAGNMKDPNDLLVSGYLDKISIEKWGSVKIRWGGMFSV